MDAPENPMTSPTPSETPASARRVLVTGATGRIGRGVVAQLVARGVRVRALTRRPGDARLPAAVEVVGGDLTHPASLQGPTHDVDAVFLVWTADPSTAPAVVELFAATGVGRVVLLSSPHRTPHPFFQQANPLARQHAELEELLGRSGVPLTVIRPGMFASNVAFWWGPAIRAGEAVRWPYADVETAPVDDRDVSEVAAIAILDASHAGADHVLTGPESLSHAEQVRIIGDALGRPIAFEELSPDQFRRATEATWPAPVVDMLLSSWAASVGMPAFVSTSVSDALGSARTFRQWADDNAAAFGG